MLVGHFAVGLLAKRAAPNVSLGTLAFASVLAPAYFAGRRYRLGAILLFGAVVSHWLLDFVSHKPDMPLAPGTRQVFGLGLWSSLPATVLVESGLWIIAVIVYARAVRPKNRAGVFVFWGLVALLTLAWINNIAGPPPANTSAVGIQGLIFFSIAVAAFYGVNRLRPGTGVKKQQGRSIAM